MHQTSRTRNVLLVAIGRRVLLPAVIALALVPWVASAQQANDICPPPANPIVVKYELYSTHDALNVAADGQPPCSKLMLEDLEMAETLFVDTQLPLRLVPPNVGECVPYTPIRGSLGEFVQETAKQIFFGPQRSGQIEEFKARMKSESEGEDEDEVLHIYYVDLDDMTGYHLRNADADAEPEDYGASMNLIFMGTGARPDSLAHEFGHAFSLGHVNFWDSHMPQREYCAEYDYWDGKCNFDDTKNLMWAGGGRWEGDVYISRTELTEGQRTRALCNIISSLVKNGDYANPPVELTCPDWSVEGECPVVFDPDFVPQGD